MMNKPKVRIKGFEGEWCLITLNDECQRVVRKNVSLQSITPLTISAQYGLIPQTEFFNSKVAGANLTNYYLIKKGEFAYNKSSSQDYPYGAIKRLDVLDDGVLSTLYIIFSLSTTINSDFLASFFDSSKWHSQIRKRASEGARNHGLLNISAKDFFDTSIAVPDEEEQSLIGRFFIYFDTLISTSQDKLNKLKSLKICHLNRLFPIGGGKIPPIRLAGFSGEWEEQIAGDIFESVSDKGHPDLPVLSATQDRGMIIRDDSEKIIVHDKNNEVDYKRVQPGQFVIHLRSFQGGFAHSDIEGITSPAYTILRFKEPEKHDAYFWKYVFSSKEFILRLKTVTYGIRDGRSINYEDFLKMKFQFPKKEEQIVISTFLKEMDSFISLHSEELERLKSLKQSCLESMFVNP